ncbi:helix-turn-helix domain-containing protein [Streptomyces sp. NPDC051776]|uniref:TetR/AcrR family transcriptional regulator n=1 Tax=Streptomyces sp. NPDC051776 TaxID=3155414 RepID=UPI0034372DB4
MEPRPTRTSILDAAARLMRSIGLARATTKEIAKAAGCSEAALYKHFASKEDLFVHVLEERLPRLGSLLSEIRQTPAEHSVEENLTRIARRAVLFYESSVPMAASLFAEPALLRRHRDGLRRLGGDAGPHRPLEEIAAYLDTERDAGRIRADADTEAAAALLLGACYQRAFLDAFTEEPAASENTRARENTHAREETHAREDTQPSDDHTQRREHTHTQADEAAGDRNAASTARPLDTFVARPLDAFASAVARTVLRGIA